LTLRHQIIALAIVPLVISILAITTFITWQSANLAKNSIDTFEQNMLKTKEAEILNLTNLALSAIQTIYDKAGPEDEAAKQQVSEILTSLDYGKDGYFFVYDYDGNNIVHPRQSFRHGHNWLDLTDPDGDKVIAELIATAKAGGGLHQYKWQKPSTGQIADKLSFVVSLDKWHWVVGTGVYLDDVFAQSAAANADMRANIRRTFIIVALIAVPSVLVVFTTCMLLTFHERRMADSRLKALTQRVIDTQEEERARLARELHDGISQNLVGVRYAMDLAGRKVRTNVDDAALTIDRGVEALNGDPGIFSARWAGETKDFSIAMQRVEDKLAALPPETGRDAHFVCALALAWPDGHVEWFEGRADGVLVWPPRGENGFGYDPVFVPNGHDVTYGEMDPEAKHAMSHRADAFRQLVSAVF